MIIRFSKIIIVFAMAFYISLICFSNITNYGINFEFVRHVLLMDTVSNDFIAYRSISSPIIHHLSYVFIIIVETFIAIAFWMAFFKMLFAIKAPNAKFKKAKNSAIIPLCIGFILWQVGFMTIGGEWFGAWQSKSWNGQDAAFRIVVIFLLSLIYLTMVNEDSE